MREIKFRIWNPPGDNMLYDIDNVFECLKQQVKYDKSMPDRGFVTAYNHRGDGMVWMQYTGLKDKNGVEIYEGDIVKDIYNNSFTVLYNEYCSFMLYPIGNEKEFMAIYPTITLIVIGNIHSNPELLK